MVASRLNKTISEIDDMPIEELIHWLAFFKLQRERRG